jgi:predicted TIM-barrel fold metal-dependent hydrolase
VLIDAHLHCTGRERADDVLRAFDDAGVDVGVLLAPFLSDGYTMHDADSLARANAYLAALVRGHEDRLVGLAVVNPRLPGAEEETYRALGEHRLRGLKMVPSGWVPADDCAQDVFAVAAEFRAPILFHSGIFIDGRSGRYCRPVEYEAVREHPALKVTLAHLGWPWCDEANAVGVIDLINGVPPDDSQFRFDISFGPPPPYRIPVLRLALDVLTPALLQFGSDCFLPCAGREIAARIDTVRRLFDELDVAAVDRERIFAGTAAAWLGLTRR